MTATGQLGLELHPQKRILQTEPFSIERRLSQNQLWSDSGLHAMQLPDQKQHSLLRRQPVKAAPSRLHARSFGKSSSTPPQSQVPRFRHLIPHLLQKRRPIHHKGISGKSTTILRYLKSQMIHTTKITNLPRTNKGELSAKDQGYLTMI